MVDPPSSVSVDERILKHMIDTEAEFLMEVTDKTKADVKVGAPFNYDRFAYG